MKTIRIVVGQILLFINWLTFPKKGRRQPETQNKINEDLLKYSIYEFKSCPFCVRVRRTLQRLDLPIELRDAKNVLKYRSDLLDGGGKVSVPCLRTRSADGKDHWMYESKDIVRYLERQFPLT